MKRESQADSVPSMEPDIGLNLMRLRSLPEPKPRVGRLIDCTTQEPLNVSKSSSVGDFWAKAAFVYCRKYVIFIF